MRSIECSVRLAHKITDTPPDGAAYCSPRRSGLSLRLLWWNEARVGCEDRARDRPCGMLLTRVTKAGNTVAYVLLIAYTPPLKDEHCIEIP
jgi:hypothetical protein